MQESYDEKESMDCEDDGEDDEGSVESTYTYYASDEEECNDGKNEGVTNTAGGTGVKVAMSVAGAKRKGKDWGFGWMRSIRV